MSALQVPPSIAKIAPDGNLSPRQLRRLMIEMVSRRVKPGAGSSPEFLKRRTAMISWPDLRPILTGVPWALVSGVATRAYMAERATKDMDIIVHERDGKAVIARLQEAGYQLVSPLAIPGYVLRSPDGTELDVIFGRYRWLEQALSAPKQDPAGYPVVGLPYLVMLKMESQRPQDWADVSRMLGWASEADLDEVRKIIKKFAPEDMEDIESLIFIGKKERENPTG